MINIRQNILYDLSQGDAAFEGVRLWNLDKSRLTVQVNFSDLILANNEINIQQSLDGINWTDIDGVIAGLDKEASSYTFNLSDQLMNYGRVKVLPQKLVFAVKYGLLYNWYAASDVKELANSGWHIPVNTELITLSTYLGGGSHEGGVLKEVGTTYWDSPNTGAANSYGFNARGAGGRASSFASLKISTIIMTKTTSGADVYVGTLSYDNDNLTLGWYSPDAKNLGMSIRLIKDSTILTHGQAGLYVGNDGKTYPTICIGTQEWMADNLCETKYRDGTEIPEVTDNTTWAGLTTGARCSYNNDPDNGFIYIPAETGTINDIIWRQ